VILLFLQVCALPVSTDLVTLGYNNTGESFASFGHNGLGCSGFNTPIDLSYQIEQPHCQVCLKKVKALMDKKR
jgi:hypothetical protein